MTRYTDNVKPDTPRLIVRYKVEDNKEMFEWGHIGAIPVLNLICQIIQIQNRLSYSLMWLTKRTLESEQRNCPEQALIVTYNPDDKEFDWYINDKIPFGPIVGYLEMVKLAMITTPVAARAAAQHIILGTDGQPMRR